MASIRDGYEVRDTCPTKSNWTPAKTTCALFQRKQYQSYGCALVREEIEGFAQIEGRGARRKIMFALLPRPTCLRKAPPSARSRKLWWMHACMTLFDDFAYASRTSFLLSSSCVLGKASAPFPSIHQEPHHTGSRLEPQNNPYLHHTSRK